LFASLLSSFTSRAQIDPIPRKLVQFGYNAPFQGRAPISAYAYYYWNSPDYPVTNVNMRLAIAPTYLDSEFGFRQVLGDDTDIGLGFAGGGFADSYDEIRKGTWERGESFIGHGAETTLSIYHCFNPASQIPLNGVLRGIAHYSFYARDDHTADNFTLPNDHGTFGVRTGLRWGGKEPVLYPTLAMELSIWYEGEYRTGAGGYGFADPSASSGFDRSLNQWAHQFWGQALLAYTFEKSKQSFFLNLTAGTSINADRFSAYRLGALLPLVAEFPLSLPGYYFHEISAKDYVLFGGNYMVPLDRKGRWNANLVATTAGVDYIKGLEQPGQWHSGVGAGILYQSTSLKILVGYGYGVDAIRDGSRGAHSIGVLMQLDLQHAKHELLNPNAPDRWRGFQRIFGAFGD
jgi:hypothetical protein